jgi:hypothetical protein
MAILVFDGVALAAPRSNLAAAALFPAGEVNGCTKSLDAYAGGRFQAGLR